MKWERRNADGAERNSMTEKALMSISVARNALVKNYWNSELSTLSGTEVESL